MAAGSAMRHSRWATPPSSVYEETGGAAMAVAASDANAPRASGNIMKIALKLARVASSTRHRSARGPFRVCSWGRIRRVRGSSARKRASRPTRARRRSSIANTCSSRYSDGSGSGASTPSASQRRYVAPASS